jgi:YD repeat-containing protein
MQNMSYMYDDAGNVTTITDALAGPQTQELSYNAADMVIQASAAGGTYGLYSENYCYSSGNLYNKGGVTNTYGDTDHPHAVTERSNGNTYVYDANGNQTRREIGSDTYDLKYDAENRLVEVKKNSTVIATFAYDGDPQKTGACGKQVKGTVNGVTTYYVGAHYQKQGTQVTRYYYAGTSLLLLAKLCSTCNRLCAAF